MKITVIGVGKIKEKYFTDAIKEYSKRLSRYCKLDIVEVADEKTPDGASETLNAQIKEKEGVRILQKIPEGANVGGISQIVFVIGGSLGLAPVVLQRADYKLSFSKMTFPHQLMRVVLLEQIYRSFRIRNNEPYHK